MRAVLAVALLLASMPASAFAPTKHAAAPARTRTITTTVPASARAAFSPLVQRGWRASWDRDTGVPTWVWGSFIDVPGATSDAMRAEVAAHAFISAHLDVLAPGARMSDLVLLSNRLDGDMRTVAFEQRWRGMRVVGGQLGVVIAHDRLFAASSSAWPHVRASVPTRGELRALEARATAWIEGETRVTGAQARAIGERVVVPAVGAQTAALAPSTSSSTSASTSTIHYDVAELIDVTAPTGERWDVYIAPDGRALGRRDRVMFASATLQYNVGIRHGGGARTNVPAPSATITVNGLTTMTDSDGDFSWLGTSPSTVIPGLVGTFIRIINQAGPLAEDTLTAQPGSPVVWMRSLTELSDAQISTFIYGGIAKARARVVNPAVASWLDEQFDFYVNENGSCNAFSGGDDVHLFRSGPACENTGRVGDVVFHEFGHALHKHSVIDGMGEFETHLSEGLADFFAANLTGDPAVGRGFFRSDEPLRQIDPVGHERVYPADLDFDPHISGLIIAGALWDLRKALIASLGLEAGIARAERIFTGVMQRASDIGTTFTAALIADDDDGSLGNGTPNECAIRHAFGRHGLVADYVPTHVSPPVVDAELNVSVTVTPPPASACAPIGVTAMTLTWRANDGVASELAFAVHPELVDAWRATFPPQEEGTVLSYSVDVRFADGSIRSFPDNPADPRYQYFTGGGTPVWCETFDADPAWAQTSTTSLEWEWDVPEPGSHDPPTPVTGTHVLGTRVGGAGRYRPMLVSSIETPVIDVSAFEIVRLQYWRWLTVEDAQFDRATIVANGTEVWRNATAINGTLDHVDREWRFHDVDVTPHVVDGAVTMQWTLATDVGKELGGWTIDDVCIVGLAKIPRCGDGEIDVGEQCDDGNRTSDDGCARDCIDEVTAGGGGCCQTSDGTGGATALVLVVVVGLRAQRRRRASSLPPSRSVSLRMP